MRDSRQSAISSRRRKKRLRLVLAWPLGIVLSFGFIWTVSALWGEQSHLRQWDDTLRRCVNAPGVTRYRREGRAITFVGKHGINIVSDISKVATRKVAIFGDSYMEAFQVPDRVKTQQQFNDIWNARHEQKLFAFVVARAASGVADYYFQLPVLERIAKPVGMYVIAIGQMKDLYPVDIFNPGDVDAKFYSRPQMRLERGPRKQCSPPVKVLIARTRTDFILPLTRTLRKKGIGALRFTPGPVARGPLNEDKPLPPPPVEAWAFLLRKLTSATDRALVFVYLPTVPRLSDGHVSFVDPQASHVGVFGEVCAEHGVGFINMGNAFINAYRATRQFSRGFPETSPGEGHLNERGHRAVAEALCEYIKEHGDAVFAD